MQIEQRLRDRDKTSAFWMTGAKMGVGTSYTYALDLKDNPSKVWFTLADGAITEVMYPSVDIASVKELTCLISDGKSFIHDETKDCLHTTNLLDRRALAYQMVSTDKEQRYQIIKEIITDPTNPTLLIRISLKVLEGELSDYKLYLYYAPHIGNSGEGDSGYLEQETNSIIAWDKDIYAALKVSPSWFNVSLREIFNTDEDGLITRNNQVPTTAKIPGKRIAFVLELPTTELCTIALGFGPTTKDAVKSANNSLARGFALNKRAYINGWKEYCNSLDNLNGKATDFYYLSAMIVKAHEDKTQRGAIIASLSLPWGNRRPDEEDYRGYRFVWPRDLYHSAIALLAAGDKKTVADVLLYLDDVLQKPDGSFPQNAYIDGTPYWHSIQMDEVSGPIIIAWWLGATDRYKSMVKPAADYIIKHGPTTLQERWEENSGYSPATIAAEIAGLVCAADLARQSGDENSAKLYLNVADEWQENIAKWCFTTNGLLGTGRYFLRVSPEGNPNKDCTINLANYGGLHDQRAIVDPSFLELVRLGVMDSNDPKITESLLIVDQMLKVITPSGPSWYRYNFDGYGETNEGGTFPGKGHLWTFLTGERGMYELACGLPDKAKLYLEALEQFANLGGMLPEQVWEDTGKGTGSATPLVWSHGEYIVLLKSITINEIIDRPDIVYDRYIKGKK